MKILQHKQKVTKKGIRMCASGGCGANNHKPSCRSNGTV